MSQLSGLPATSEAIALLAEANELQRIGRHWPSRVPLAKAIALLQKDAPDSEELACAYRSMCWAHVMVKCRKTSRAQHQQAALGWYEKAISVWERRGEVEALAGNLCNIGA